MSIQNLAEPDQAVGTDRMAPVTVGVGPLSFEDVVAVARHGASVEISSESLE